MDSSPKEEIIACECRRLAAVEARLCAVNVEVRAYKKVGVEGVIQRSETAWLENQDREELYAPDCSEFILKDLIRRTKLGKDKLTAKCKSKPNSKNQSQKGWF